MFNILRPNQAKKDLGFQSDIVLMSRLIELLVTTDHWFCEINRVIRRPNNMTFKYYRFDNITVIFADGGILESKYIYIEGFFSKQCVFRDNVLNFRSRRQRTKLISKLKNWIDILENSKGIA